MRPSLEPARLDFAFAENASPTAEARIRRDLARIVAATAAADARATAVVLTGGFSRGEGTIRADAPVNDYDVVVVRARPGGRAAYRALAASLHRELGIEVDLLPIWARRLPRVGRKLFWLDARLGGRVIAGEADTLERLPDFGASELERHEIARLLGNRAAGLLLALPGAGEPDDRAMRDLQATKAVLAALDATLLHAGRYAPRLRERLSLARGHADHALFAAAVDWKLAGKTDVPDDWWDQAAACLLRAVDETRARDIGDGLVEHAYHALRARSLRPHPSRRVREEAWALVGQARYPHGPPSWAEVKPRFFEARGRTLQ